MFQGQSTIRANLVVVEDANNGYGLVVVTANRELMRQDKPVRLEVYRSDEEPVEEYATAYFATEP
jgi:hypothetical protein